jgi:hypothetical protein
MKEHNQQQKAKKILPQKSRNHEDGAVIVEATLTSFVLLSAFFIFSWYALFLYHSVIIQHVIDTVSREVTIGKVTQLGKSYSSIPLTSNEIKNQIIANALNLGVRLNPEEIRICPANIPLDQCTSDIGGEVDQIIIITAEKEFSIYNNITLKLRALSLGRPEKTLSNDAL